MSVEEFVQNLRTAKNNHMPTIPVNKSGPHRDDKKIAFGDGSQAIFPPLGKFCTLTGTRTLTSTGTPKDNFHLAADSSTAMISEGEIENGRN